MGALAAGCVVLLPFPYSDLSAQKLRPALVLGDVQRGDWVLCQITSQPYTDMNAIKLVDADFRSGSLHRVSYARPGKLFTANSTLFRLVIGALQADRHRQVVDAIIRLLKSATP